MVDHAVDRAEQMRSKNGFTLVELLVSVALVAVVGAAAFATFSGSFRIWERSQALGVRERQIHLVLEQMRRDLSACRNFRPIPLKGEYDQVSFSGLVPVTYRRDNVETEVQEIGRVGYLFNSMRRQLCRSAWSYRFIRRYDVRDGCRPVLDEVEGVRFSYYKLDEEGVGSWSNSWDEEEKGLPLAVKIEVSYRDDPSEPSQTQTLVVPLPLGGFQKK